MGARPTGVKLMRRAARSTELELVRLVGNGGYDFTFTTADHKHGVWNKTSGRWHFAPEVGHFTSCRDLFDEQRNRRRCWCGEPLTTRTAVDGSGPEVGCSAFPHHEPHEGEIEEHDRKVRRASG